jgi:hypothetical protein
MLVTQPQLSPAHVIYPIHAENNIEIIIHQPPGGADIAKAPSASLLK